MTDKTVFFDLETGGVELGKHPIIQIAAIAVDTLTFQEIEQFEVKIHFDVKECSPEALEVNSFEPEAWKTEAVEPAVARARFSQFLSRHATVELISKRGRPYYVARMAGHNAASFDGPFIQKFFRDADEFLPGYFRVLDTCQLAQWFFFGLGKNLQPKDMKLATLCEHLGICIDGAHDALVDVRANVQIAKELQSSLNIFRRPS